MVVYLLRKLLGRLEPVPLTVRVSVCKDRCTKGFEDSLPERKRLGQCNSSHGGSCCACGGPLPDSHIHLNASCLEDGEDFTFGGNVCGCDCLIAFYQWLARRPPMLAICPGHGESPKVYPAWGRHREHAVKVEAYPQGYFVREFGTLRDDR